MDDLSVFNIDETNLYIIYLVLTAKIVKNVFSSKSSKLFNAQDNANGRMNTSIDQGIRFKLENDRSKWDRIIISNTFSLKSTIYEPIGVSYYFHFKFSIPLVLPVRFLEDLFLYIFK